MASSTSDFNIFANNSRSAGNAAWSSPINARLSDNAYAVASGGGGQVGSDISQYLQVTSATGLSLPQGATIDGIQFSIERKYASGEGETASDQEVYIVKGGTRQTGQNKASGSSWPTIGDSTATYGGAADLWGLSWSTTDFGSGFGVALAAKMSSLPAEASGTWSVDHIFCTVTYTEAGGGGTPAVTRSKTFMLLGIGGT